jgi:hypothetical protein
LFSTITRLMVQPRIEFNSLYGWAAALAGVRILDAIVGDTTCFGERSEGHHFAVLNDHACGAP